MRYPRWPLALCGLCVATPGLAQSITSLGAAPASIPVGHPLVLAALAGLIAVFAFAALRRHRALAAIVPVLGASILLWSSPALRAALLRSFANPAGETLPIPVQQIPGGGGIAGFEVVDYRNDSGARLVISRIQLPTREQCFPTGISGGLLPPTVQPSPPAACAVGAALAPASVCRVDVDTVCRGLSGVTCYDSTLSGYVDVQYTGVSNSTSNLLRFSSTNGTCSGTALGSAASAYVIEASSLAEADALCPLAFTGTMASYGYVTAPANLYVCITSAPRADSALRE